MKTQKDIRILTIFTRLTEGKSVDKGCEACRYGVSERTIQRHIDSIRAFLAERQAEGVDNRSVIYDKCTHGYLLKEERVD